MTGDPLNFSVANGLNQAVLIMAREKNRSPAVHSAQGINFLRKCSFILALGGGVSRIARFGFST